MTIATSLFVFALIAAADCNPLGYGYIRPRRTSQMMFGGYMGQGWPTMNRDMVATNSFLGYSPEMMQPPIQYLPPTVDANESNQGQSQVEEELDVPMTTTIRPKKSPKKPTKQPEIEVDDDGEGQQAQWPFGQRGNQPAYNAFFPIMFGGNAGGARNGGAENGGYPGSAVAIANSFSTGKGGVAASHATAYGDPYYASAARRNGGKKQPAAI